MNTIANAARHAVTKLSVKRLENLFHCETATTASTGDEKIAKRNPTLPINSAPNNDTQKKKAVSPVMGYSVRENPH